MRQCLACGGTYEPLGADGVQYFHACPPLSIAELQTALDERRIVFSDRDAARYAAAKEADAKTPPGSGAPSHVQMWLASLTVERPNKRDENIGGVDERGQPVIKREGDGVEEMVSTSPTPITIVRATAPATTPPEPGSAAS